MKFTRLAHAASLALLLHVGSVAASPLMDLRDGAPGRGTGGGAVSF